MKKIIALLMTLALLISAVLPALAEETGTTVDQVASATQKGRDSESAKGGRGGNRQRPGQNSTAPQAPDTGVTPQAPGQDSQDSRATVKNSRNGKNGKNASAKKGKAARNDTQLVFDRLLAEGVITREVYDAITAWLNSQSGQAQAAEAAPAENSETVSAEAQLLKSLLDSGAITQEQYDLLLSRLQSAPVVN